MSVQTFRRLTLTAVLLSLGAATAWGQPQDTNSVQSQVEPTVQSQDATPALGTEPTTTQTEGVDKNAQLAQRLIVTVLAFKGNVRLRNQEDEPWRRPRVGMKLDGNAEFRTGPRSWVHFRIPPNQLVSLDRLGTIKVWRAVYDSQDKKVKTDLGMRYGRTRFKVQAAGVDHESVIHTPGNTLAVRGTDTYVNNTPPYEASTASYNGEVENTNSNGDTTTYGDTTTQDGDDPGGDNVDQNNENDSASTLGMPGDDTPLTNFDSSNGPANNSFDQTNNTSDFIGQTGDENQTDTQNQGSGFNSNGVIGTGDGLGAGASSGSGSGMTSPVVFDRVDFDISWPQAVDLDSFVIPPGGPPVCVSPNTLPGCITTSTDAILISNDAVGPNATERITFQGTAIPSGDYEYGVRFFSGTVDTSFNIDVVFTPANGQPQSLDQFSGTAGPQNLQQSKIVNVQVQSSQP